MKILDRAPMPLSKYALGGKLSQSAWIISLVCQLCQAYKKKMQEMLEDEDDRKRPKLDIDIDGIQPLKKAT